MKKSFTLFVGLLICMLLQSQIVQISDPILNGGRLRGFANNGSCVMVATSGGIFKTLNQGQSWTNVTQSFDPFTVSCDQIVNIGAIVYVRNNSSYSSSVYYSSDCGGSWSQMSFVGWSPQSLGKIGSTLYAIGNNPNGEGHIFYSTNGGASWTSGATIWNNWAGGNSRLYTFNQSRLYLYYNGVFYYTTDGASVTTISSSGINGGFQDESGLQGDAAGNLFYRTGNVVYKYNFSTTTWSDISTGKIPANYQVVSYSVTDDVVFLATMSPNIGLTMYKSTDKGSTFSAITAPGITIPMIERIMEIGSNIFIGNNLYEQIVVSANGGDTWTEYPTQFVASYAGNLCKSGSTLAFSTNNRGIAQSSNSGVSWTCPNNGIPSFGGIAYFVNDMISVKDTLFSFLKTDPFSSTLYLYKSSNSGTSWKSSAIPSPYNTGSNYQFSGKSDSTLFVSYYDSSTSSYALIESFNNGAVWVKPKSQNSPSRPYLKGPKNCVFAFFANDNDWNDFTNVYMANSYGVSFTDINPGNLFGSSLVIKRKINANGDKDEAIMDVDKMTKKALFAVRDFNNSMDRIYSYDIQNNTWTMLNTSGLPANYIGNCIKNISANEWILATNEGIYRSTNGGVGWGIIHTMASWQKGVVANNIELIGTKLFVGTLSNGIWTVDIPTGVLNPYSDEAISIYPIPFNEKFTCKVAHWNDKMSVTMYNSIGKKVFEKKMTDRSMDINLPNLAVGHYILVVSDENNYYKKLVIKK